MDGTSRFEAAGRFEAADRVEAADRIDDAGRIEGAGAIRTAVENASSAARGFRELGLEQRTLLLRQAARAMLERRHQALEIVERELGKARGDALFSEVLGPLDAVNAWAKVVGRVSSQKAFLNPMAFPRKSARNELVPRGVVGVIAPWNFPMAGLYRSVFPALLLGNAVVIKPSEYATESGRWFIEVLSEALPPGVVQGVYGDGGVGAELLESGIDACVFTGSSRVGSRVEARAFELGIACSAEMGGNDGAIVLADADLERTSAGIVHWALQNAGQACGSVEVVFADSRIAAALTAKIADACARLRPPLVPGGPGSLARLAHEKQLHIVLSQLEDAKQKGATVVTGGQHTGLYLEPTVVSGCSEEMALVTEETFGPVIPIVSVDGPAEAIRSINRGKYGLTASIWSRDIERAERLAEQLEVGVVTVNNHAFTGAIAELPWSGRRASGRGIASSAWSLLTFARPKVLAVDRSRGPDPYWVPFDQDLLELGDLLADAQLGRLGRAFRIPLLLRRRIQTIKRFFQIP
jgi:acyl-CoA reductase-like NAD-dependent aldehyde dehydrogenase